MIGYSVQPVGIIKKDNYSVIRRFVKLRKPPLN